MFRGGESDTKSPLGSALSLNAPQININSDLKDLNNKRSSVKGRVTKYKNFLNAFTEETSISRSDYYLIEQRIERFRDMLTIFDDIQAQIETLNSEDLDGELDIRENIESDFSLLIAKTKCILEKNAPSGSHHSECSSHSNNCNNNHNSMGFKLPVIKISNFDGSYFKWLEFRDSFCSLIDQNNKIEPIHKFYYLNSYLEGEASRVISNLEISSANYKVAWELLCERYNNIKHLKSHHLHALCNMQQQRDSAKSLRTYRTRDRFLRLEFLRRLFWKRWMLEYITQLQARQKWRTPGTSLQLGDLVLLKEENAPPMHWKVGRITALFPGEDGVARAADVRTTTGTYRRGTRYLCPLLDPAAYSLEATASNAPEDVPAHC
uniref:DUF5641 domain-containing protein n=2 Tax=Bombyx mori TaxID=7091 RepID=A0A8R2M6G2_BOMMO|nr:uncharacterized protein LOC101745563 isoform X1 [Bombyx mori]